MSRRPRPEFGRLAGRRASSFGPLAVRFLVDDPARKPFSIVTIDMRPGARHPAIHHARTEEFFLVLAGSCRAEIGGRRRLLKQGDFAFLPAGTRHAFHAGRRGLRVLAAFSPSMDFKKPDIIGS